ncbi:MAG TPA: CBS domain-containing protein [Candidatus Binatus sp.]|nr:CBS domain-containing protein [Candidatus Binatus sp.]
MICPVCQWQNFLGEDTCENCGADLSQADTPEATSSFHGQLLGMRLDKLGAPRPVTADAETSAGEAIERMRRDGVDCLLVIEGGALVGIFTDRDAVLKVGTTAGDPRPLREVMTPDPVVLRHDDPVAVAIHKMAIGGFRHVPVLDDGTPIAVVSAKDVFRHLAAGLA